MKGLEWVAGNTRVASEGKDEQPEEGQRGLHSTLIVSTWSGERADARGGSAKWLRGSPCGGKPDPNPEGSIKEEGRNAVEGIIAVGWIRRRFREGSGRPKGQQGAFQDHREGGVGGPGAGGSLPPHRKIRHPRHRCLWGGVRGWWGDIQNGMEWDVPSFVLHFRIWLTSVATEGGAGLG